MQLGKNKERILTMTDTMINSMTGFIPECSISFNGGNLSSDSGQFSRLISYSPILFCSLIPAFLFRMAGAPAERETLTFHCLLSRFSNTFWAILPRPIRLSWPRIPFVAAISRVFLPRVRSAVFLSAFLPKQTMPSGPCLWIRPLSLSVPAKTTF